MRQWGGRFETPPDRHVQEFTQSIDFDRRLFQQDVLGSVAHCRMLAKQGIIEPAEGEAIEAGLRVVAGEAARGEIRLDHALEDVHTHVETRLHELVGPAAGKLGFAAISRNSLDTVGDRDFVVEYLSTAALTMAHLSRLAEEIVLWTTSEFDYLTLDDSFTTGSSIMPQKKNPDVAELVRGK